MNDMCVLFADNRAAFNVDKTSTNLEMKRLEFIPRASRSFTAIKLTSEASINFLKANWIVSLDGTSNATI